MKHSHKNKKPAAQPQRPPALAATGISPKRWAFLGLSLIVAAGVTWAIFEYVVWATTPSELVGKWVVMEGPDEGGTVDFYRNGTMVAKVNDRGRTGIIEARIRVEGKKIHVTTKHQQTGELGTRVQTIKVLDDYRLVLEDERGMSVRMERAD